MKIYSDVISLSKNSRGVSILDTTMGCSSGMKNTIGGCYGDCYSAKAASRYGIDFSTTVIRKFKNRKHELDIIESINKIDLPFVRIGGSGDPSEDWEHTLSVINVIRNCNKEIVIITRHWDILTNDQLDRLSKFNVCVNTSVSALDKQIDIDHSISQYERLKPYCKSVLRVITCDFNLVNPIGRYLQKVQESLTIGDYIDTVFRPSPNNYFVTSGIVNTRKEVFNGKQQLASKMDRKTYMGKCGSCLDMCGCNIKTTFAGKRKIVKQLSII